MNAARCMGLKAVTHQPRYRPSQTTCHATLEDTLSFYSILDVPPSASRQEIRAAYLQAMKELHPDKHRSDHASSLNDLCSVINEVYEILSDDDKREAYDVVSGFSERSLNPFMDSKVERDQLFVDEANCIGCGKCVRWAPQTFEIEASKYGRARVINQRGNTEEEVQIAIEVCPVDTIHFVSIQQLQLLEAALATMPLVEVFVMQRSGKLPGNVFQEASRRWEGRRRIKTGADTKSESAKIDWDFFDDGKRNHSEAHLGEGDYQQISKLAASAARAMRLWRIRKESERALITDGSD